jgi:hypothetical protein
MLPQKRLLRLELAGAESPGDVAREIRKHLAAIARSRSFIARNDHRRFANDLEAQRRAIADRVAQTDPAQALELMWRLLDLAQTVYDRCDDSNGAVGDVFRTACADLGELALAAKPAPTELADQAYAALTAPSYGQFDGLIKVLTPALGPQGLEHLKQRMIALSKQKLEKPEGAARKVVGWSSGRGQLYADDLAEISRVSTTRLALKEIADAQGDIDAYIAQYDAKTQEGAENRRGDRDTPARRRPRERRIAVYRCRRVATNRLD